MIGRIACWIECLKVEPLTEWVDVVGEVTSNVDRRKGEELGDARDLRGNEIDRFSDLGEACGSTVDSTCSDGACSRLRSELKM